MNSHNTLEKMRSMRLKAMVELYQQSLSSNLYNDLSLDGVMDTLIDAEWEDRQQAAATDIDYHPDRGLDKTLMGRLLSLNFVKKPKT